MLDIQERKRPGYIFRMLRIILRDVIRALNKH